MVRTPTATQYADWQRALDAGEAVATNEPSPGYYLRKEAPGVMTPCSVSLVQPIDDETGELLGDELLICECGGIPCDANEAWGFLAKRPISKAEYDRRLAELITGETETLPF